MANKTLLSTLLSLLTSAVAGLSMAQTTYAEHSALAAGDWYKISVPESGVYKLTYDDLKSMGLHNPAQVKIYGYGGALLSEDFSVPAPDDLPPVAIWMSAPEASFKQGDYILFYAQGSVSWRYETTVGEWVHTNNHYSGQSCYFVTENSAPANLMGSIASTDDYEAETDVYSDYYLHENDLNNVWQSGREYYGESLRSGMNLSVNLPGFTGDTALLRVDMIASPQGGTAIFGVDYKGQTLASYALGNVGSTNEASRCSLWKKVAMEPVSTFNLVYQPASATDKNVYLNYLRLTYTRQLKPYGACTLLRSLEKGKLLYRIAETNANCRLWDITEANSAMEAQTRTEGSVMLYAADNSSMRQYALVDLSKSFPKPKTEGKVANQDLHASPNVDMLVIVQPVLQPYAEELAKIHLEYNGLKSLILTPDKIYNEFSSGSPDATAYRRCMKLLYDKAPADAKPRYLLLFGDGSFDNRQITDYWQKNSPRALLLTYQSKDLINPDAYCTDDYFGFLLDGEGQALNAASLTVGVGRLPVRSESEAAAVVNKIETYLKNDNPGVWQNRMVMLADDAIGPPENSTSTEIQHIVFTDKYANYLNSEHPDIIVSKIYEDAFERQTTSSGARYPEAQQRLLDNINSGCIALNFSGHGSVRDWTHEYIFTYPLAEALSNEHLALWITATCNYAQFDNNANTAAELLMQKPTGGAIALFSTTRSVAISENDRMNYAFIRRLFDSDENGQPLALGDIYRLAKQDLPGNYNKLRYVLIGDPALQLQRPAKQYSVQVDEIDGQPADSNGLQIKALSHTAIKGSITDEQGNVASDFNGMLEAIIFDNRQSLKTRGQTGDGLYAVIDYYDYPNQIYNGKVNVSQGQWEINFAVPKDILYTQGQGKMSFLACSSDDIPKMASGSFQNYSLFGTEAGTGQDLTPPSIDAIYLNDKSFREGDAVNPTPLFVAEVSDESGINLSNAVGHNISLALDQTTFYDLTTAFINSGYSTLQGSVKFQLPELSEGKHQLVFKVWDVWNNSQQRTLDFEVSNHYKPVIMDFDILGNPASDHTRLRVSTNLPGSKFTIRYEALSLNGALVWRHEETGTANRQSQYEYNWDLRGNNGTPMGSGVYIVRAIITTDSGAQTSKSAKLIIKRQ